MEKRYLRSQLVQLGFQVLIYLTAFLSFFLPLSIHNEPLVTPSRTSAVTLSTFVLSLFILTKMYGGFELGGRKARSVLSSLVFTFGISDCLAYFVLEIMNVNPNRNAHLMLFGEDLPPLLLCFVLQALLTLLWVWLSFNWYYHAHPRLKCLIVTSSQEQADHVAQKISTHRQKFRLNDVVHYEAPDIKDAIMQNDVVFLAGIPNTEETLLQSYCYDHRKPIYLLADLEDVIISTAKQIVIDDAPFLEIARLRMTLPQRVIKRGMDIVLSVACLVVFSPAMLLSSLAILMEHDGPVLFRQKRATIGGRVFSIIKFRTMHANAQAVSATENDDRITKVGRFLRKFRLDELPQLFNILAGDMSFVGPRPEMLENVDKYSQEVPEFVYRQQMKAGLTGLAQIDGKYNTTPKDKVILDLMYIENFSLMMDVKLLLRTLTIIFRKDSTEGFAQKAQKHTMPMRITAKEIEEDSPAEQPQGLTHAS